VIVAVRLCFARNQISVQGKNILIANGRIKSKFILILLISIFNSLMFLSLRAAPIMQKVKRKKDWSLNSNAFRNFLVWLDEGSDSGGQKYLEMRQRLVAYFDYKNCRTPNELADETLNRVARRLEEKGTIESETPAKYCYIVAKFVFFEYLRTAKKESIPLDAVLLNRNSKELTTVEQDEENNLKEKNLDCLKQCVDKLETVNREIIVGYYYGKERVKIENRRSLAAKLGISMNALTIRACRIRDKLETCVRKCVG
jgi:DNA-directed RNA polymerase specialized sigma24 family protein